MSDTQPWRVVLDDGTVRVVEPYFAEGTWHLGGFVSPTPHEVIAVWISTRHMLEGRYLTVCEVIAPGEHSRRELLEMLAALTRHAEGEKVEADALSRAMLFGREAQAIVGGGARG